MTKDEALKTALEALEHINDSFDLESVAQDATTAITAIKEALAQPAWVSLTEDQKDSLLLPFGSYWVIDTIEAMLKENNGV